MSEQMLQYRNRLLKTLDERFDKSELRLLCAALDVDYDNLKGETKIDKASDLIEYLKRRNAIPQLVKTGKKLRPDITWEDMPQASAAKPEDAILQALYEHFKSHPDAPEMTFNELYEAIGVLPDDAQGVGKVHCNLFFLQRQGKIQYSTSEDQEGMVKITSDGIPTETPDMEHTPGLCPASLVDLIQKDPECARLIQREELLQKIIKHLDKTPDCHFIVLVGQPLVGKTRLLERLREKLDDEHVPLMVTGQGLELNNALDDFDAFVFDLADQLTNQFRKWARRHGVPSLNHPQWDDFKGRSNPAFAAHWHNLRQIAGKKLPLVIFDEIERLLDFEQLDSRILTFLSYFVRNPSNGYFILAGSERMRFQENEQFSKLIAQGELIRVCHYDEKTIHTIFSRIQKYLAYEEPVLQHLIALCDGHPRILNIMLDATFALLKRSPGKQRIEKDDIEPILTNVLERIDDSLWLLRLRLSQEERAVVWLIGQTIPSLIDKLEYSLQELVELADQLSTGSATDRGDLEKPLAQEPLSIFQSTPPGQYYSLIKQGSTALEDREWVEWKNWHSGLLCFKLGIFPLWARRRCINLDQVRH